MDLVNGHLYWTDRTDIIRQYLYLSEDTACGAAIIGAGITGALCAYYLADAGINTLIVDKNIIGYGSTSASTSLLQYEVDYNMIELSKMIGTEKAVAAYKCCEQAVYELEQIINSLDDDCEFKRRDSFLYTTNAKEFDMLQKEYYMRKATGFEVDFFDSTKAKTLFSFPVAAGIYSRCGSGEVNPYKLTQALIHKASLKGLRTFENTEIVNLNIEKDGITLLTNNHKKIKAQKIIVAVGYDAEKFIDESIVKLNRTFTIITRPVSSFEGWHNRCLIRDSNKPYNYLRTTADDRIIIGGLDSKLAGLSDMKLISNRKFITLLNILKEMFPKIPGLEIEYAFSSLFGETADGLPYIGQYEGTENIYFSLDYGSNGILYGVIGGQIIQKELLGKTPKEAELFKFNR